MTCLQCASGNQKEFTAEVNLHFPGLKNLDKPSVFVFPKVLVCLDCGFSRFAILEPELTLLAKGTSTNQSGVERQPRCGSLPNPHPSGRGFVDRLRAADKALSQDDCFDGR